MEDFSDKVAMMEGLRLGLHYSISSPKASLKSCRRSRVMLTNTLQLKSWKRPIVGGELKIKRSERDVRRRINERRSQIHLAKPIRSYLNFNAPIAQVHMEIKNEFHKYYEFHKDHGQNTKECFQLKEQIAD